ncbi:MAG: hypothetical protein HY958_05310 [Bacteroidia bacterium]|nr:hypothetical protein [Bacteroidia bacterium]
MPLSIENKIVNSLWIGDTLSNLELLTIKSFIANGHTFRLWMYEEPNCKLPGETELKDADTIIPKDRIFSYKNASRFRHGKGSYAGFSDIFRYKLLCDRGGWWADMDVCCLKPFDINAPYVFRKHHVLPAVGNIMKCPPESGIMKDCYREALATIDENNRDWHKPIHILNRNIKKHNLGNYITTLSNHDSWAFIRKMAVRNIKIPDAWYAIHWVNVEWERNEINKDFYLAGSTLGLLMKKHGMESMDITEKEKAGYRQRLTLTSAVIRRLFG